MFIHQYVTKKTYLLVKIYTKYYERINGTQNRLKTFVGIDV